MTLLVRCDGPEYQWHDGDNSGQGSLDQLQAVATGQRLVIVMPGEQVLLTEAIAPRRNRSAWRQALPYALEDQLATEVERLHFALGRVADRTTADGHTPIAVVERQTLHDLLEPLQTAGLTVQAVVPEPLLLPLPETGWSILVEAERALVRTGPCSGFAADPTQLPLLLTLALDETTTPEQLLVHGQAPTLPDTAPPIIPAPLPGERLELLHRGLQQSATSIPLNLLQGPFGPTANLTRWLRPWRAAAVLTGLLLTGALAQSGVEYWQLQRERSTLQAAIEQTFRQAVPDVQRIVNPRVQLANHLQAVAGSGADNSEFLSLLAYSGEVLREFPELSVQALRFRAGRLEFDLEGGSLEQLEQLQARLRTGADHTVQLQASMREDRVVSRLSVQAGAS